MKTINSHVEDYLTYFCALKYPPEYAVLLKGSWGAGKTWFIKKYCDKLKKQKQKFLYVSLYGMTTFAEIEDAFFQQLHPVLSSKGMAITSKIFKSALKTTLKIDLDGDKKENLTLNSEIPDIKIPDYFKNTDNCILIFDDLERCPLSIEKILGYINHFVEHQGLKVIIVANEDQIIKNENGQNETDKSYKLIKEKLIGKTFAILPDIDAALPDFINKVTDQIVHEFMQKHSMVIKEMYSNARYENLRILKQSLWDFERLYISLSDKIKRKDELVVHLLRLLLAFSFEIRNGKIMPADIGKVGKEYFSELVSKGKEKTKFKEIIDKYATLYLYETLLTEKCWVDFFDKGIIDDKSITESLLKSRYFEGRNTPNWVKLWHYFELTDDKFENLLRKVETEFKNKKYKDSGVIKHVTGLLLRFSEIGLYKKDKAAIFKEAKEAIDDLKTKKELDFSAIRSWDQDSYGGLGFAGSDIAEFRCFDDYIKDKMQEAKIESMPYAGTKLLRTMKNDVHKFYGMVGSYNSSDQTYYETPIFKFIKPSNFVKTFMSMKPRDRRTVIYALDKRYEFVDRDNSLVEELDWVREVRNIMIQEQKILNGKVSGYNLQTTIKHDIDKFIKKIESAKTNVAKSNRAN